MVSVDPSILKGFGRAGLIIIGAIVLLVIIAVITMWVINNNRNKKKFKFLLLSVNGKNWSTIYGMVKADPVNPSKKKFFFEEYDTQLEIEAPQGIIDGKPVRFVTQNHLGELNYLSQEVIVDKEAYLKVALKPEEKAITLHRYKEQQMRFQQQFDKLKTTAIILGIVMLILVLLATVGSIYVNQQTAKTFAGVVKDLKDIEQVKASETQALKEVAVIIAGTDNGNYTRTLT